MVSTEESDPASCSDDYTDMSDAESCNKITMSMQNILLEMVKKRKLLSEHEMMLTYYAEDVDNVYDKNKAVDLFDTITPELKLFAVFLHFYSPASYKHIRENYNTPLPSSHVLYGLYENNKYQPGFTKQAFDILAKRKATKDGNLICSLIMDSLQLFTRHSSIDVDVGAGPLESGFEIEPSEALVILLVSLEENWKIPVGFFIAEHPTNEIKAELIKMTLSHSHVTGVDIVSITQSVAIAELLGCKLQAYKNLKTTFRHPECDRQVAVFIDPTICLRSVQIKFQANREMYDDKKRKINWELISKLEDLKDTYPFGSVSSVPYTDMVNLCNIFAKLGLVIELFSLSVAEALQLCKNRFKLLDFKDAEATIEFITIINILFNILHSKKGQNGFMQPISRDNSREILEFLDEAKNYISSIYYFNKLDVTRRSNITNKQVGVMDKSSGFKGFLISIESLKHLYITLVEREGCLECLATHRLAWDHADDFFQQFRRRNPQQLGRKFQPIYKSLFKLSGSDLFYTDRAPIQSYPISNLEKALDIIKKSSGKRSFDELFSYISQKKSRTQHDTRADANVQILLNALHVEKDQVCRKQMVGYISGWLVVQLAKGLRCEECVDALFSEKKMWFHKFITLKELRGVCLPSEEVFRVCWECERAVRGSGGRLLTADGVGLRRLLSRTYHIRTSHLSHHLHLNRAIVAKYLRLRLDKDVNRPKGDLSFSM